MRRERFNHLFVELSVLAGAPVPRYALWLRLHELGLEPETLSSRQVRWFCDRHLEDFLAEYGLELSRRARRKLLRVLTRGDPIPPAPDESASPKLD